MRAPPMDKDDCRVALARDVPRGRRVRGGCDLDFLVGDPVRAERVMLVREAVEARAGGDGRMGRVEQPSRDQLAVGLGDLADLCVALGPFEPEDAGTGEVGAVTTQGDRVLPLRAPPPDRGCGAGAPPGRCRSAPRWRPTRLAAPPTAVSSATNASVKASLGRIDRMACISSTSRVPGNLCSAAALPRHQPRRRAPMRSRSPDRCVPVGARARPTHQNQGSRSASQISSQTESAHLPCTRPARHQAAGAAAESSSLSEFRPRLLC